MVLGGDRTAVGMLQQAIAAGTDLVGAFLLRWTAGRLQQSRKHAASMSTAYICCAAAALLAGCSSIAASVQNLLLLGAVAAALTRGGALLSATLLAVGGADWLPGGLLLAIPLALLSATPPAAAIDNGSTRTRNIGGSSGGSRAKASSTTTTTAAIALKPIAAYCFYWAAGVTALLQLQQLLTPTAAAHLDSWLGLAGWQAAVPYSSTSSSTSGSDARADPDQLAWVGARTSQQPWHMRHTLLLPAASLQPGLGLHWYLLAQTFPRFRAFFIYVLQALPAATMLPLALRFPHQPQLLLSTGALLRCLLHPRPVPSMAALAVALLPPARPQLAAVGGLAWHALGLAVALLLSDSTFQLWLGGRGGNANFLYGMNLLWGGLQVMLLLRMLRAAARGEAKMHKGDNGNGPTGGDRGRGGCEGRQQNKVMD